MKSIVNQEDFTNSQQNSECLKRKSSDIQEQEEEENFSHENENCKKQKIDDENHYPEEKNVELKKILQSENTLIYGQSSQASLESNKADDIIFTDDNLSNVSEAELSENVTDLILKEVEKSSKELENESEKSPDEAKDAKETKETNNGTETIGKESNTVENAATNGNGDSKRCMNIRKNIRDVISDTSLDPMTLNAQKQESERLARLQEQQKLIRAQSIRAYQIHLQQQQQQHHQSRNQHQYNEQSAPPPYYYPPYQGGSSSSNHNNNNYNGSHHSSSHQSFYPPKQGEGYYEPKYNYDMHQKHRTTKGFYTSEVVTISDDEDDGTEVKDEIDDDDKKSSSSDDCIILSDTEDLDEDGDGDDDDAHNSGMHVNDVYNIPDEEGRVLVNLGHPDNEPDIFLAKQIARAIKPHQIGGVRFLYDNIIESVERFKTSTGFGCILAHSMGLGKTLQLVSFCDIFLRHTSSKTILCIMPINTLQNWLAEFDRWLPSEENQPDDCRPRNFKIFVLNDQFKTLNARSKVIMEWAKEGGVLLIGYELFRLLTLKVNKKNKKDKNKLKTFEENRDENAKHYNEIYDVLVKPGPDLVICDEGHRIKNSHASASLALKQIGTKRRIVLTGYPLQNNLLEYWCMIDFVRPNYLGTKTEFSNMFERPIQNGQCIDSTPEDKKLMRYRSHVLHSLLLGFVQRRSSFVLEATLPKKEEYIILLRMSSFQRLLYDTFMNEVVRKKTVPNPLKAFAVCCKIWNHPDVLYNFLRNRDLDDLDLLEATGEFSKKSSKYKPGNMKNYFPNDIDIQPQRPQSDKDTYDPYLKESSSIYPIYQPAVSQSSNNRLPEYSQILDLDSPDIKIIDNDNKNEIMLPMNRMNFPKDETVSYTWAKDLLKGYCTDVVENSSKMVVFFHLLEETIKMNDRILVFSQSLLTLNIIETFLSKRYIPDTNIIWKKNLNYYRLDGSTPPMEREKLINEFNRNSSIHLFLVSTKAGSLGINLVGANRVIVFDASWNPCHDAQAICRVYRYGQQKPCFIYRLVMDNCLEKKIYDRQVNKQGISDRIVDECNPDAHLLLKEITNLCFDDDLDNKQVDPDICKSKYSDILIQKMIEFYSDHLSKEPFFHESLLVDRKEKKLSVAEKRLAQRSYEIEKRASTKSYLGYGNMINYSVQNNNNTNGNNRLNINTSRFFENRNEPELNVPPGQYEKFGARPTRWIPMEIWQRQGMSAQEMILPSDVTIPTSGNHADITLKTGQKVMVLKSLKGIYMQLESGKIIAIKTPLRPDSPNSRAAMMKNNIRNEINYFAQTRQNPINENIEIQDLTEDEPEIIEDNNLSNNNTSSTETHSNSNELIDSQPVLHDLGINYESQESSSSSFINNINNDNISFF